MIVVLTYCLLKSFNVIPREGLFQAWQLCTILNPNVGIPGLRFFLVIEATLYSCLKNFNIQIRQIAKNLNFKKKQTQLGTVILVKEKTTVQHIMLQGHSCIFLTDVFVIVVVAVAVDLAFFCCYQFTFICLTRRHFWFLHFISYVLFVFFFFSSDYFWNVTAAEETEKEHSRIWRMGKEAKKGLSTTPFWCKKEVCPLCKWANFI